MPTSPAADWRRWLPLLVFAWLIWFGVRTLAISTTLQAAQNGDLGRLKWFLDHGVSAESGMAGVTPLMVSAKTQRLDVMRELLARGADPNHADIGGRSALRWAANFGGDRAAQLLLERGADPNLADKRGHTPLGRAIAEGYPQVVDVLLRHRADPNKPSAGVKPLSLCWQRMSAGKLSNSVGVQIGSLLQKAGATP